ncbi:MAG TPA: hypothetical protein DDZ88_27680 [Verrucomicrobiales bacterium]|nr:hypothetical protein [Verrucomicrobiales bacterium]
MMAGCAESARAKLLFSISRHGGAELEIGMGAGGQEGRKSHRPTPPDAEQARERHQPKRRGGSLSPARKDAKGSDAVEALKCHPPIGGELSQSPRCRQPKAGDVLHSPKCHQPMGGDAPDLLACQQPKAGEEPERAFSLAMKAGGVVKAASRQT